MKQHTPIRFVFRFTIISVYKLIVIHVMHKFLSIYMIYSTSEHVVDNEINQDILDIRKRKYRDLLIQNLHIICIF